MVLFKDVFCCFEIPCAWCQASPGCSIPWWWDSRGKATSQQSPHGTPGIKTHVRTHQIAQLSHVYIERTFAAFLYESKQCIFNWPSHQSTQWTGELKMIHQTVQIFSLVCARWKTLHHRSSPTRQHGDHGITGAWSFLRPKIIYFCGTRIVSCIDIQWK